ncbi:MAG: hypothetical protein JW967_05830 [Dehalococcoidales bacterium]|nr:hypothetical protein [Dehalococcoidales bacterium]
MRHQLESTGEFEIIDKDMCDNEITLWLRVIQPEMVICYIDEKTSLESFLCILIDLHRVKINLRTIILADNPLVYLKYALKTGVAALLHRQIDLRDLTLVIHEICAWYRNPPKPCEYLVGTTNLVLRLNQEVENM